MSRGTKMKLIEDAISRLEAERAAFNARIDGRIEGLKEALHLQNGGLPIPVGPETRTRVRRGNLKETVLDLMAEAKELGLTTDECVVQAKSKKGVNLNAASVSSLLSRLKHDGILFYDGQKYRLKDYAGPRQVA